MLAYTRYLDWSRSSMQNQLSRSLRNVHCLQTRKVLLASQINMWHVLFFIESTKFWTTSQLTTVSLWPVMIIKTLLSLQGLILWISNNLVYYKSDLCHRFYEWFLGCNIQYITVIYMFYINDEWLDYSLLIMYPHILLCLSLHPTSNITQNQNMYSIIIT